MAQSIAKLAVLFAAGTATGAAAVYALQGRERDEKTRKELREISKRTSMPVPATSQTSATLLPTHAGDALKLGFPGPVNDLHIRSAYATAFDRERRNPKWVVEHLTAENLGRRSGSSPALPPPSSTPAFADQNGKPDRSRSEFKEDQSVPMLFRARLNDYFKSGFDRGHMCPAADAKLSQEAMNETFLLTNIAPQVGGGFNRDYWAHLEDFCRRLTNSFKDVYVYTVPLYLPRQDPTSKKWTVTYEVIGNPVPNVAVPTHFAKVVYAKNSTSDDALASFVLPNAPIPDSTPLTQFLVPIDAVERASGLTIFEQVNRKTTPLCSKIKCDIIVRKFKNTQKQLST